MARKDIPDADRKYRRPNELGQQRDGAAQNGEIALSWEQLAKDCLFGNYVLVVGADIMLDADLSQDFFRQAAGNSEVLISSVKDYFKEENTNPDFYKCHQSAQEDICDTLYLMKNNDWFCLDDIEPSLKALMRTKCFPIVVTTTYDPYVEMLMKDVWGNDLRIMNIYEIGSERRDIQIMRNEEFRTLQPTLYYAFGKADYESRKNNVVRRHFTVTDNDKLMVVDQWLRVPPKNIRQLLSRKRTMAIGCKQDDWLFRMLWYIWRGSVKELNGGEVILDFSDKNVDGETHLQNYLRSEGITFFNNARFFMSRLTAEISSKRESIIRNTYESEKVNSDTWMKDGVFLSYASEDFLLVNKIYNQLKRNGYNVWMDVKLDEGNNDDYSMRISKAISECKVFMPIISRQVLNILQSQGEIYRYFYKNEWLLAEKRMQTEENIGDRTIRILPVLTDQMDFGKQKLTIPDFIQNSHCFDLSIQSIEALQNRISALVSEE